MDASIVHTAVGVFSAEADATDPHCIRLVSAIGPGGARDLWTRHFGDLADRDAVLERFQAGSLDLTFLARVTMIFGPAAITEAVDRVVEGARKIRRAQADAEAQRRRDHQIINLYAPDTKRGYKLELQRKSDGDAEWSVRYDRASERDRLCDWLRWQKVRFGEFLDHAAAHGAEALTRLLIDEMFETERRIKKEGRGAGGMRPLRMWRGD
jgi:hypothetical protein